MLTFSKTISGRFLSRSPTNDEIQRTISRYLHADLRIGPLAPLHINKAEMAKILFKSSRIEKLEKRSSSGDSYSQFLLSNAYMMNNQPKKASTTLLEAADNGNADAQVAIAQINSKVEGMTDYYNRLAFHRGHPAAAAWMLTQYSGELGRFKNDNYIADKAFSIIKAHSDYGNPLQTLALGKMYVTGFHVKKNIKRGAQYMFRAAILNPIFFEDALSFLHLQISNLNKKRIRVGNDSKINEKDKNEKLQKYLKELELLNEAVDTFMKKNPALSQIQMTPNIQAIKEKANAGSPDDQFLYGSILAQRAARDFGSFVLDPFKKKEKISSIAKYIKNAIAESKLFEALSYFKRAADQNHSLAAISYAELTPHTFEKIKYFQNSIQNGNLDSAFQLSQHLLNTPISPYLNGLGMKYLKIASSNGHPKASYCLALAYYTGNGVVKNVPKAIELMKDAAIQYRYLPAVKKLNAWMKKGEKVYLSKIENELFQKLIKSESSPVDFRDEIYETLDPILKKHASNPF